MCLCSSRYQCAPTAAVDYYWWFQRPLSLGAKIIRRKSWGRVEQVTMTEPIEGGAAVRAYPEELGGTRHQSAAQFVHDQRDAAALVASQDGRFTIFQWSPAETMVHAHRIET